MKRTLCNWLTSILIIAVGTLLFVLVVREIPSTRIIMPGVSEIGCVEIININNKEDAVTLYNDSDISYLIRGLQETSVKTHMNSVSDQPTEVPQYYMMKFYYKNIEKPPTTIYLYKKKRLCYIEQPYSGIWRITQDLYNSVVHMVENGNE